WDRAAPPRADGPGPGTLCTRSERPAAARHPRSKPTTPGPRRPPRCRSTSRASPSRRPAPWKSYTTSRDPTLLNVRLRWARREASPAEGRLDRAVEIGLAALQLAQACLLSGHLRAGPGIAAIGLELQVELRQLAVQG